jgi:hypothetical protein
MVVADMTKLFNQTRSLLWCGITGIVLATVCTAIATARGVMIPPEGDLTKAITFDAAVGIYILTIALLLPLAGFTPGGQSRWVRIFLVLNLYAYAVETTQMFRGIDPRFSRVGGVGDQIVGVTFGLTALGLMTTFLVLAVKLWRRPSSGPNGLVLLAVRYASVITVIGFGTGFWMGSLQGRHVAPGGNILPLHAICFHALQAIPLVAWLFTKSKLPEAVARPWVHAAGLTWLGICVAVAWQTAAGLPVTQLSSAMLVAYALTLAWVISLRKGIRSLQLRDR